MQRENDICLEMIYRSCVIKKTVVENDPTEQGERAVLIWTHPLGMRLKPEILLCPMARVWQWAVRRLPFFL